MGENKVMADPVSLTLGAIAAAATVAEGYGTYQEARYESKVASANADVYRQNAARKRLETAINEDTTREQNRRTLARNIAASSEQGMANSATAIGALGQQATDLEQNALNIRYEGISAAEGIDIQADYYDQMSNNLERQGKNKFYMSLLKAPISFAQGYTKAGGDIGSLFSSTSNVPTSETLNLGGKKYKAFSLK